MIWYCLNVSLILFRPFCSMLKYFCYHRIMFLFTIPRLPFWAHYLPFRMFFTFVSTFCSPFWVHLKRLYLHLIGCIFVTFFQCDQKKIAKCLSKLPKNDSTWKMIDFDTFTKIAYECGRFGQINCCQRL